MCLAYNTQQCAVNIIGLPNLANQASKLGLSNKRRDYLICSDEVPILFLHLYSKTFTKLIKEFAYEDST